MRMADHIINAFPAEYLNRNITLIVTFAVIIAARLFLKRYPRKYSYMLWALFGIKVLFNEGLISFSKLFHAKNKAFVPTFDNTLVPVGKVIAIPVAKSAAVETIATESEKAASFDIAMFYPALAFIWAVGFGVMIAWGVIGYVRLSRKVKVSFELNNGLYSCDYIDSPMVFGFINPKIYIPSGVDVNDLSYVIKHEKIHLKRKDTLYKMAAFVMLSFYWMNPFAWVAFKLFNLDMELSCDEKVLSKASSSVRSDYGKWLVFFASKGKVFGPVPTAFGVSDIEKRVKNMDEKKNTKKIFMFIAALVVVAVGVVCLITIPKLFKERNVANISQSAEISEEMTASADIDNAADEVASVSLDETETTVNNYPDEEPVDVGNTVFYEVIRGDDILKIGVSKEDDANIDEVLSLKQVVTFGGTVKECGYSEETGHYVVIEGENGESSRYDNLDEIFVKEGDTVAANDTIGASDYIVSHSLEADKISRTNYEDATFVKVLWPIEEGAAWHISMLYSAGDTEVKENASNDSGLANIKHTGVDIACAEGTDVLASISGTVEFAGWDSEGGGNTVILKAESIPMRVELKHLKSIDVKEGDSVTAGDKVGEVGSTGNSTGPHLHYAISFDGNYVDPMIYHMELAYGKNE